MEPIKVLLVIGGGFFLIMLASAAVLRTAVLWHNKIVGGKASLNYVPVPNAGTTFGILIQSQILQMVVGTLMGIICLRLAEFAEMDPRIGLAIAALITLPVNICMVSVLLMLMLPCSFKRAVIISLAYCLIMFAFLLLFCFTVFTTVNLVSLK